MTEVVGAVVDMAADTQLTPLDLPTMVRLSSAILTPTATAIADLVTTDSITADLVTMVMNSPADMAYSTAPDTSMVDTQWRIQPTAIPTIAADPSGHRISRTIV